MNTLTRATGAALTAAILAAGALGAGAGSAVAAPAITASHAKAQHSQRSLKAKHTTKAKHVTKHTVAKRHAKVKAKAKAKSPAVANLTAFENALLSDMNAARAAAGVPALKAEPGTTDVARRWSLQLAENDGLSHNPNVVDQLEAAGSNAWTTIDENVGTGPANNEKVLFAAYMASPHHRENILDPTVKFVGVGAVEVFGDAGLPTVWNTVDFVDAYATGYGVDRAPALSSVLSLSRAEQAF